MTCFIRKYCQFQEENFNVHKYNTQRKIDIHVKMPNAEEYKKSLINMGATVYNNLHGFIKVIDDYKASKKELELFLSHHSCYSVEEFVSS